MRFGRGDVRDHIVLHKNGGFRRARFCTEVARHGR